MANHKHLQNLHFLLIPLMSQSHIIPLTDLAKLIAKRGLTVTIITTPSNAIRYGPVVDRAQQSGLRIRFAILPFPAREAGLPDGCENMDSIMSPDLSGKFYTAMGMLQEPVEKLVGELNPRPSCIVSTSSIPWTSDVAVKFGIPMYIFHTIPAFSLWCNRSIGRSGILETIESDSEAFLVPEIAHKIEITKSQLAFDMKKVSDDVKNMMMKMRQAESIASGVLVNSFQELEPYYVEKSAEMVKNFWCIGPVSLCNNEISDKFDRGNKASVDEHYCLKWLDSHKPSSVIYACFGSLARISPAQLKEIGLGLESSNRPFVWIIREVDCEKLASWLEEEKFEERVKGRGLIIRGWGPQVLILSHPSVGGFLTHCGWNSTLEGISAGMPMITWPMFSEQFFNEKLVVNVLGIGVRIGVDVGLKQGDDAGDFVVVKRDQLKKAIEQLMDGEEGEEIRKRARELGEMAKRAMEEGGSSFINISKLIQDVMEHGGLV